MDTIYRDSSIPEEYKFIYVDGDVYYFFDDTLSSDSNGYYVQYYSQGAYFVDYVSTEYSQIVTATERDFSSDYVYRCDVHKIFFIYFCILILLFLGVKILTRFIYHKGI